MPEKRNPGPGEQRHRSVSTGHQRETAVTRQSVQAALGRIDELVHAEMDRFGVPGVAVSLVHRDEVVFSGGYGVRRVGTTDPVDPQTVFQVASVSKPITATAVAGLVGQGVIKWDDPVRKYAPELRLGDPWVTDHVTFADLYSHRSGLPGSFGDVLEHIGYTREEILGRFRHAPLEAFRASYSYNNFGLTAAGDAAAKAAGTTFAELMQQQLFGPAGMTASSADNVEFLTRENRAAIHIPIDGEWQVGPTRQPDAQAPAGGVSASLHDISTWVRLVLGAGTLDGTPIIDRAALTTTHLPHVVRAPLSGYDAQTRSYGLGWNLENDHLGFLRWSHSGAFTAGAATTTVLLPTEQLGVVVLTNGKPIGVPEIIADGIIDQVATGGITTDWRTYWHDDRMAHMFDEPPGIDPTGDPTPARTETAYLGIYRNDVYGDVEVISGGAGLAVVLGPARRTCPMTHRDADSFTIVVYPELPDTRNAITFTIGTDSRADQLDLGNDAGPGTGLLSRVA